MHLEFYGLNEKALDTTPDARFRHLTPGHREALAHLLYGVRERRGFIVLTGGVGTGKTTLLHALVRRLEKLVLFAFVPHCRFAFEDILEEVILDFNIVKAGHSRSQRLAALNTFLLERRRNGHDAALILDDAQNLPAETLEQIRLLSRFENPGDRLLQIILAGQPGLLDTLQLPRARQFRRRIALGYHLPPLTPDQTRYSIATQLRVAAAREPVPSSRPPSNGSPSTQKATPGS